ncbi:MAG: PhoX family protein [Sandaracinaceae bacterium]
MKHRPARVAFGPLGRRHVLQGGLGTLASVMASRLLGGCETPTPAVDGGVDAFDPDALVPLPDDAASVDAATVDAGPDWFEPREMPPRPALRSRIAEIGPLGAPDANGVRVAEGFSARVLARAGENVEGTSYTWHTFPDGGTCFPTLDGGWIYVSNSEVPIIGGVGMVRFDASGAVVGAQRILDRTSVNCAGGGTPWGSWLSCEEIARGRVFECDPHGEQTPRVRPALGVFKHEAVAVDPGRGVLYLTEDEPDGCFYRFTPAGTTPAGFPDLSRGRLDVASVGVDGTVRWLEVPDPGYEGEVPTRRQVSEATVFEGGEGIWFHEGVVYFSTKGDNRVWALDVATDTLRVLYDAETAADPLLRGVDNLTVSCCGDVLVAEDGGSMQIVAILPDGTLRVLVQVIGQDGSEITGPAFDPSGTRLYFSSQRGGASSQGITYVVEGPFHEPA